MFATRNRLADGARVLLIASAGEPLPAKILQLLEKECEGCGGQLYWCETEARQQFEVCRQAIALPH